MKRVCFLLIVFNSLTSVAQTQSPLNYIRLKYGGIAYDQFIYDYVISYKNIDPEIYSFGIFGKVDKQDFLRMKASIKRNLPSRDTSAIAYYHFMIIENNESSLYTATNSEEAKAVFDELVAQIKNSKTRNRISTGIDLIYKKMLDPH